jgi:hypothetical protein
MGFGSCDFSTTPWRSPYIFSLQTSWIDMILGGLPPLVSQEPIFIISAQYNEEIQSIGFPVRVSNVVINGSGGTRYYIEQ